MSLPPDLLTQDAEVAARRVALWLLDAIAQARTRLGDRGDAEALHDYRVAMRKLRAALGSYRALLGKTAGRKLRRELSALQRTTGGARDAEVAVAWLDPQRDELGEPQLVGFDWFTGKLRKRLGDTMTGLGGDHGRKYKALHKRLRRELRWLPVDLSWPSPANAFATEVAARLRDHFNAFEELLLEGDSTGNVEKLHDSRIAAKRLRYLVEPMVAYTKGAKPLIKHLKGVQDILGQLNDARVLGEEVEPHLADESLTTTRRLGVAEIARRNQARHDALVQGAKDWVKSGLQELHADAMALARELEGVAHKDIEIERKYLLKGRPDIPKGAKTKSLEQGYLPGDRLRERVRKSESGGATKYVRTIKTGTGVSRFELEEETTQEVFDALWALTEGCRVKKIRHVVPVGNRVWEIDEFLDRDLFLAEIELATENEKVKPPQWLADFIERDVTGEAKYTNLALAK